MASGPSGGSGATSGQYDPSKNYTIPLIIITAVFFMWGFMTVMNDILTPYLKGAFELSNTQAALVQSTFFVAFFLMSLPSGAIIKRIGYKNGLILGLATSALGATGFYLASIFQTYGIFLTALFVLATGITVLQVAANPYVSILGPPKTASVRLNISQGFNSLGTVLGPLFGARLMFGAEEPQGSVEAVRLPYLMIGAALLVIALLVFLANLPRIDDAEENPEVTEEDGQEQPRIRKGKGLSQYPHLWLAAFGIFCYVGAEVTIGNNAVELFGEDSVLGLSEEKAGYLVSWYWGGAMVGRFLGAFILRYITPAKLLGINALLSVLMLLLTISFDGYVVVFTVLSIGLFNSIMFPNIFTMGIEGLGRQTSLGTSVLIMAIVGGAVFPLLQGIAADAAGIQASYAVPIISYIYIAFFGFLGFNWAKKKAFG